MTAYDWKADPEAKQHRCGGCGKHHQGFTGEVSYIAADCLERKLAREQERQEAPRPSNGHRPAEKTRTQLLHPDGEVAPPRHEDGGQWSGFTFTELADLKDIPPMDWRVPGILPGKGSVLINGAPKAGKSVFNFALVKAATTGGTFCGAEFDKPLLVWYLTELSESLLKAQTDEVKFNYDGNANVRFIVKRLNPSGEGVPSLPDALRWQFLAAPVKPDLVYVDTIVKFLKFSDLNDYTSVDEGIEPLIDTIDLMSEQSSTVTVLVHHASKGPGKGSEKTLGSTKLAGAVDHTIHLSRKTDPVRNLYTEGRWPVTELGNDFDIEIDWSTGTYALADPIAAQMDAIVIELGKGDLPAAEIAAKVELGRDTVGRRLSDLIGENRVERVGQGRSTVYKLT